MQLLGRHSWQRKVTQHHCRGAGRCAGRWEDAAQLAWVRQLGEHLRPWEILAASQPQKACAAMQRRGASLARSFGPHPGPQTQKPRLWRGVGAYVPRVC